MLPRLVTDANGGALLFVLFTALCFGLSDTATSSLVVPPDSQCACIGRELTYTCTAVGRGSTLWTGTAFDCTNNWINLRHSLFNDTGRGATGDCSGGAIVGESVGVTDNCYTSRLRVRIAADMNNKTIRCDHRPGTEINTIGQSRLAVITGPLPSPSDVHPVGLLQGNLTYQWTSVAPACSSNLEHRINSMSCGTCVLTSITTATCYNVPQPMTTCSFSVQSTVCGDQVGEFSSPVEVTLKVPGVPHADIMPVYTVDGKIATAKIVIANNQTMYPYDGFSVQVSNYNISFSNSTSSVSIDASPCEGVVCEYLPDVSTHCPSTGSIGIAVSAANELGVGVPSDPISIECINSFVNVAYHMSSSSVTCTFDDPQNTTGKLCIIEYGICKLQQLGQRVNGSSTLESPNIVMLTLQSIDPSRMYCYNVTASNVSYTAIVMGTIGMDGGNSNAIQMVVAIVVPILVVAIIIILSVVVLVVFFVRRCGLKPQALLELTDDHREREQTPDRVMQSIIGRDRIKHELKLQQVEDGYFKSFHVDSDSQLCDFLLRERQGFSAGCAYYEFKHEVEYVSEDKQLVFMKDNRFFLPNVDSKILKKNGFIGEEVERPKIQEYVLFVQCSSGSGARHLPTGSMLLYHEEDEQKKKRQPSLRPLFTSHLKITKVDNSCTLKEFCDKQHVQAKKLNVFLELAAAAEEGGKIRDVILANKATCEEQPIPKLFTGPSLRLIGVDGLKTLQEEWRVFVIMETPFKTEINLKEGSFVLHERLCVQKQSFHVLEVDEDNVQMSKFVEKKLSPRTFENGRAFYEFTDKEDLNYYKEVVAEQKNKMAGGGKTLSVLPDASLFYSLFKAVPGLGIEPPNLQHVRVFVQSTSYGSRCLKFGATILYKVDNEPECLEQSTRL